MNCTLHEWQQCAIALVGIPHQLFCSSLYLIGYLLSALLGRPKNMEPRICKYICSKNGWCVYLVRKAIAAFQFIFFVLYLVPSRPPYPIGLPFLHTPHRKSRTTSALYKYRRRRPKAGQITTASHFHRHSPVEQRSCKKSIAMSGIMDKIQETLHIGGDHKKEEEHKKADSHKKDEEHHKKDGEHKEGIVEKIKDKITGDHGDKSGEHKDDKDHKEKKDKKDKKKKKEKKHGEGHHDGHSSSSSDSD